MMTGGTGSFGIHVHAALVETHNTRLRDQLGLSGSVTFRVVVGPGSVGVEGGF